SVLTWVILAAQASAMQVVVAISVYAYTQILNSEFYWRKLRRIVITQDTMILSADDVWLEANK
ncbi:hypothetical protein HDU98_001622, partial [Podochytrium sp. JEL0797]